MTAVPTITPSRVAICVCTCDRAEALASLLASLREIDLSGLDAGHVELVVVDNNPDPRTREVCRQAASLLPIPLHYTEEPRAGVTYARNRAVTVALERGAEFLAFIDDDDIPSPDWLVQLLARQADTGADLVFGTWVLDEQMPEWARESGIFRSPGKRKRESKQRRRYGLPDFASGCNMLLTRSIIERVGGGGPVFDHAFSAIGGEDKDFFIRAHDMGATLAAAEQSVIFRNHEAERYTIRGLFRRGFKNGCSRVNMAGSHGNVGRRVRLFLTALGKLTLSLLVLPFSIFSRAMFMHHLYRMAKSSGILYSSLTGRGINYYGD